LIFHFIKALLKTPRRDGFSAKIYTRNSKGDLLEMQKVYDTRKKKLFTPTPKNYSASAARGKGKCLDLLPCDYVVVDIETTGLSPKTDDIIEIAAIKCRSDKPVEEFSSLIKISRPLPRHIIRLTGIDDKMLATAPPARDVIAAFYDFAKGETLLAHNANFDINFLYDAIKSTLGEDFNNDFVDTLKISRRQNAHFENHKLGTIAKNFGVISETQHRAMADVEVTHKCYIAMKSQK
jgi:DNA polymerase-3 subunit epsilon